MLLCFLIVSTLVFPMRMAVADVKAQEKDKGVGGQSLSAEFSPRAPIDCESLFALLDNAIVKWKNSDGSYLIVISNPGKSELVPGIGLRRLALVKGYLTARGAVVVTAVGDRTAGAGTIDVYVTGRLLYRVPISKDAKRVCSGSTG